MSQIPPAALLHLREADVVRLCGLEAAAAGLDAVARHVVIRAQRQDSRLEATVESAQQCHVWIDAPDDHLSSLRFGCDCLVMSGAGPGSLGCEHVAAVLTAWIRTPAMFSTPRAAATSSAGDAQAIDTLTLSSQPVARVGNPPQPQERLTQPKLLSPPAAKRSRANLTLANELDRLSSHELLDLARRVLGLDPSKNDDTTTSREPLNLDEVRLLLAVHLRDPHKLSSLLDRLDANARLLLGDILSMGGAVTSADLDALAERSDRSPEALRAEVAVLARHGLLYHVSGSVSGVPSPSESRGYAHGQIAGWRVPQELIRLLRDALPPSLPTLPTRDAYGPPLLAALAHSGDSTQERRPARVVRASPSLLLLTLALLAHAPRPYNPLTPHSSPTPPTNPRNVGERDSQHMPSLPLQPHHSGAHAFPLMPGDLAPQVFAEFARTANVPAGLARMARRLLLWARDSDSGAALLDLAVVPPPERIIALRNAFQVWRSAEAPAELADLAPNNAPVRLRLDHTHEALRPATLAAEARDARISVLRLLGHLAPDAWHTFDDLLDLLWRVRPLFLRGRQQTYSTPAWWLERSGERRPLRPTVRAEWLAAEGAYIRMLLSGPLHWFGAFDLAYDITTLARASDTTNHPAAFRLNAIGRYLLSDDHAATQYEAEAQVTLASLTADWGAPIVPTREGRIAVQPLAPPSANLFATLSNWARPHAVASKRIIYALAPDLACEMFDRGIAPDVLLTSLRAVDPVTGPRAAAAVEPQLRAWRAEYGKSRILAGWTLIEAQDEAALVEALATVPDLAARCHRIAPSIALIPPDDVPGLEAALARRGYAVQ